MSNEAKKSYKDTLNLPKTSFPMKANLAVDELNLMKEFYGPNGQHAVELQSHVGRSFTSSGNKAEDFILHDGPPYANGPIHIGHMLNKTLKDFILRSKHMEGYGTPFTPGWDCHGLPIESKVLMDAKQTSDGSNLTPLVLRQACEAEADKWFQRQSSDMERLLLLCNPKTKNYKTMDPSYEASVLEIFVNMVTSGIVYRELKPVHWSVENKTVLADAELEYKDMDVESPYVLFSVNANHLPISDELKQELLKYPVSFVAWTTTPWSLPANEALAVNPDAEYGLYRVLKDGVTEYMVSAVVLADQVFDGFQYSKVATFFGYELKDVNYMYPFVSGGLMKRVLQADFVTTESGSGIVHIAPAHGVEDYQLGQKSGLKVNCPITEDCIYNSTAPNFLHGVHVRKADKLILQNLRERSLLLKTKVYSHSYPHDWRSGKPVITRATYQWFISVDKTYEGSGNETLRTLSISALDSVKFYPSHGKDRLTKMLESRPDWCVSRQRNWGIPIPVFYYGDQPLLTRQTVSLVIANFLKNGGSDLWYSASVEKLLTDGSENLYDPKSDPEAPDWSKVEGFSLSSLDKGTDTFDVWFESGCSWFANSVGWSDLPDVYLEGNDQHRGWFQSSLLTCVFMSGRAPFKELITHGFCLDKNGKPMHKSAGNAINVEKVVNKYGADVLRWWVSGVDFFNDVKCDEKFFAEAEKEYNKIRNTLRFILSNLYDFDPQKDSVNLDGHSLDAWALRGVNELTHNIRHFNSIYDFAATHKAIYKFCIDDLSALYFTAVKDRLYCSSPNDYRRRATQTVLFNIGVKMLYCLTPFTPYLASELLDQLPLPDKPVNVLGGGEKFNPVSAWRLIMNSLRPKVMQALQESGVKNPLDAGVKVFYNSGQEYLLNLKEDLVDLFGMSRIEFERHEETEFKAEVLDLSNEPRCERSWKRDGTVKVRSNGDLLSDRDAQVIGV